jgi:hypothetical protein
MRDGILGSQPSRDQRKSLLLSAPTRVHFYLGRAPSRGSTPCLGVLVMWDNHVTTHRITRFDATRVPDMRTVAGLNIVHRRARS